MIEERSIGVKAPAESKLERPFRGSGCKGVGVAKYAAERHICKFVEIKVLKPFFKLKRVSSRA